MRPLLTIFALLSVAPLYSAPRLRVFVREKCVVNPPQTHDATTRAFPALAGIFVPKLIEMAIGGVAHALIEAGKDKSAQRSASEFVDLYAIDGGGRLRPNRDIGCVIGAYGQF